MSTNSIPPLDSILGCLFVACILTSVLWGGATVQLVFYYNRYWKSDKWWLKTLVLVLWILGTVLQVIDVHYLYTLLIKNYANLLSLARFDIETDYETMFTAIIDALVQSFFCMRIWHLSAQNYIFTGAAAILITAQFTIQIVYFGLVYQKHYMTQILSMVAIEKARSITVASTDIFIGFMLVLLLHRNRSDLKGTNTDSVINKLILYTASTGLITILRDIAAIIALFASPNTNAYVLLDLLMPSVYINSLLASLNSRQSLRDKLNGTYVSIRTTQLRAAVVTDSDMEMSSVQSALDIGVHCEKPEQMERHSHHSSLEGGIET